MGNRYSAAITSIDEVMFVSSSVRRIARAWAAPVVPTAAAEIRPYTKDTMFRTDLEDDEDLDTDEVEPDADVDTPAEAGLDEAPLADDTDQDEDRSRAAPGRGRRRERAPP